MYVSELPQLMSLILRNMLRFVKYRQDLFTTPKISLTICNHSAWRPGHLSAAQ